MIELDLALQLARDASLLLPLLPLPFLLIGITQAAPLLTPFASKLSSPRSRTCSCTLTNKISGGAFTKVETGSLSR